MEEVCKEIDGLVRKGLFVEALEKIGKYDEVEPSFCPKLWELKCRCLDRLDRNKEAFEVAKKVYSVVPAGTYQFSVGFLHTLASGYYNCKEYKAACDLYKILSVSDVDERLIQSFKDKYHEAERRLFSEGFDENKFKSEKEKSEEKKKRKKRS